MTNDELTLRKAIGSVSDILRKAARWAITAASRCFVEDSSQWRRTHLTQSHWQRVRSSPKTREMGYRRCFAVLRRRLLAM